MSLSQQKEPTQALAYWRCGTFLTKGVLLEEVPSQRDIYHGQLQPGEWCGRYHRDISHLKLKVINSPSY